jgi:energy-converting hydrogenase Eha subunit C
MLVLVQIPMVSVIVAYVFANLNTFESIALVNSGLEDCCTFPTLLKPYLIAELQSLS